MNRSNRIGTTHPGQCLMHALFKFDHGHRLFRRRTSPRFLHIYYVSPPGLDGRHLVKNALRTLGQWGVYNHCTYVLLNPGRRTIVQDRPGQSRREPAVRMTVPRMDRLESIGLPIGVSGVLWRHVQSSISFAIMSPINPDEDTCFSTGTGFQASRAMTSAPGPISLKGTAYGMDRDPGMQDTDYR
jgi:hypothetical protein